MVKRFAAFIMTYERAEILHETLDKILRQSLPPDKIVVVDNSASDVTEKMIYDFHPKVVYHRMGYNAGPAGAAYTGLSMLAAEGYKWIYWGDDDDPPPAEDTFERLIRLAESYEGKCGQVGMVGHRFNRFTSTFARTTNDELHRSRSISVDSIGGNQCKIISGDAVREGILPDAKLFFGFEELDFDLALRKHGYHILVDSQLFLDCRMRHNRLHHRRQIGRQKKAASLWRDYYSVRNMLFITRKNHYYLAMLSAMAISMARAAFSFRHGVNYGIRVWNFTASAIRDFFLSRYGMAQFKKKPALEGGL